MFKRPISLIIFTYLIHFQVLAADNLYSAFSLGYSDVELSNNNNEGMSYKLAFGYQIDPQWYVEAGYQQLIHDSLFVSTLPSVQDVNNREQVQQADALFLAFLGKASGPTGELFYRLGVLNTDIRGQQVLAGAQTCELGQPNLIDVVGFGEATLCDYDEGGIAGVLGIGFDYFIGARTMVRAEIEYIKGQDSLSVTIANIGFRYNF